MDPRRFPLGWGFAFAYAVALGVFFLVVGWPSLAVNCLLAVLSLFMLWTGWRAHCAPRIRVRLGKECLFSEGVSGQEVWQRAEEVRVSLLSPMLTCFSIHYRDDHDKPVRHQVVITPGRMRQADFRRLRIWLSWETRRSTTMQDAVSRF